MSFNRTNEDVEIVLQIVKKLKCFDRYPMYVKRELAKVLYYDCFNRGRVVIKQGKLLPGQSGDDGGDGISMMMVIIVISMIIVMIIIIIIIIIIILIIMNNSSNSNNFNFNSNNNNTFR